MSKVKYHVFYEDHDFGGFHIGSYSDEKEAIEMGQYLWSLFENRYKQDAIEAFNCIIESSREFPVKEDTEFIKWGIWDSTTGLNSLHILESEDPQFVEKYIRFRGEGQAELMFED